MEIFGNIVYYIIAVSLVFPVDWLLKAVRKKYNDKSYEVSFCILMIADRVVFILAMVALMGALNFFTNEPEAIDVYRGKTDLYIEQTMIGNKVIKSDTTVVFKQKVPTE